MPIELKYCWLRWRRGETIEALAKEYKVTRERMRYRLKKLDQAHPAMLRDAALEEAARVADRHATTTDWIDGYHEAKDIAVAIRALKNQNPESTGGDK